MNDDYPDFTSKKYDPIRDTEPYDVMIDDKLTEDNTMEELSKLLDEHKRISRTIEYDGCLMSEQRQLHANAETDDDREAYFNSILRLQEESDRNENKCDLVEQSIVKLFEEAINGN